MKKRSQVLLIVATILFLAKTVVFLHRNPSFVLYWDWPGHIQKAKLVSLPWKGGWDTSFWGGYPTTVYPNFYHSLLRLFIGAFNSEVIGAAVLSMVIFVFEIHAAWSFASHFNHNNPPHYTYLAFLATVVFMSLGDRTLMGSFMGTLFTGGGPGALGTALLLYFFCTSSILSSSLLLGLMLLTHPLTAAVGLFYAVFDLLISTLRRDWERCKPRTIGLLIGLVIGLPWILPKLDPTFSTTAINLPGSVGFLPWVLVSLLCIAALEGKNKFSPLWITAIVIGILSILPDSWVKVPELIGVRGIHFFRFQWFLMIVTPTIFASSITLKLKTQTTRFIIVLFLVSIIAGEIPKQEAIFHTTTESIKDIEGRVLDVSRHAWLYSYTNTMEHQLVSQTKLMGSTRWIYEAGSRGLLYFTLKNAIDPASFKDGTYLRTFNDALGNPRMPLDIKETANLLGINYVTFTSTSVPEPTRTDVREVGNIQIPSSTDESKTIHYYLEKISDEPLILSLSEMPSIDPRIDLGEWWINSDRKQLFTRESINSSVPVTLSQPPVSIGSIKPTRIEFSVDSQSPAPILLKFSYSPYWVAHLKTPGSFTSQPIWVTPGHMIILANGSIELKWETPSYQRIFTKLSVFTFVSVFLAILIPGSVLLQFSADRKRQLRMMP